jgi:retinol-binding protein 3
VSRDPVPPSSAGAAASAVPVGPSALPVALAAPTAPSAASASTVSAPDTPAGRQLAAWLQAFNSGQRASLLAYHARHFPYAVASRDVSDIEREHGLSQGTGGFELRRIEKSDSARLVALLQERNSPQHARVSLQVSPQPPHAVTSFRIGPVPTPPELLPPAEREARTLDASKRRAAFESIGRQLGAHYVYAETATLVSAGLQKKLARGDYDALTDAVDFAEAVTRDLQRLSRDKHLGLRFGPLPPKPDLAGGAPPWIARAGYGFGAIERLRGNVALLALNGFPPLFEEQKAAIAERMSQIADADAVIVDLRGNGGGFPPTVARVASYFFDPPPVHLVSIYRRDTDHTNELWTERELSGRRFGSQKPVFVLTGPHTFSGGEGFAYELQAQKRAIVVGEVTAGGAHPVEPYPVDGGFVINVPWGRAINPITGTNWEGIGIVPDVYAPAEEALATAHRLALERLGRE